jgi:hypothetical protein
MPTLAALLTLALASMQASPAPALSSDYPAEGPVAATMVNWPRVRGEIETSALLVHYELLTDPARPGLYAVTRYRLTRKAGGRANDGDGERTESEKLIWNASPGSGAPLRCFAREDDGRWSTLAHDSREFKQEMGNAIAVYMLHRQALLERESAKP